MKNVISHTAAFSKLLMLVKITRNMLYSRRFSADPKSCGRTSQMRRRVHAHRVG